MNVPWRTILLHGPTIVEAARKLYVTARGPTAESAPGDPAAAGQEPLRRAVATLTEREIQHAALLADLAKQAQEVATALEALRARTVLALVGAAFAVTVALLSVALAVWRVP